MPQAATIALVAGALLFKLPYAYYVLLRCVCCAVFAYVGFTIRDKNSTWTWVFGALAAIYNPFVPLRANREFWIITNIGTIIVTVVSIIIVKPDRRPVNSKPEHHDSSAHPRIDRE